MYFFPLIVKFLLGLSWSSVGVWVEYNSAPVKLYFSWVFQVTLFDSQHQDYI